MSTEPMTVHQFCDYAATEICGRSTEVGEDGRIWIHRPELDTEDEFNHKSVWSPHTDLNQLQDVYLAAEKLWDADAQGEGFESCYRNWVSKFVTPKCDKYTELVAFLAIAWIKHPELVLRAIVEAHKEGK